MAEHPILFSGPMVRAILEGRKTVTRRPVTVRWGKHSRCQPFEPYYVEEDGQLLVDCSNRADSHGNSDFREFASCMPCPFGRPGDRLWVRETWASAYARGCFGTIFQADGAFVQGKRSHKKGPHFSADDLPPWTKWRPSLHMPRWASRLSLEVLDVRAERLSSATNDEAEREGFQAAHFPSDPVDCGSGHGYHEPPIPALGEFLDAWDAIYSKGPYASTNDPWVWRIEFRKVTP